MKRRVAPETVFESRGGVISSKERDAVVCSVPLRELGGDMKGASSAGVWLQLEAGCIVFGEKFLHSVTYHSSYLLEWGEEYNSRERTWMCHKSKRATLRIHV